MAAKLLEIAASIVRARASAGKISLEEIEQVLIQTFFALQRMQNAEQQGVLLESADESATVEPQNQALQPAAPKDSIRENRIVCLECGIEMKQLTRKHLDKHGLTQKDYKKKWGFSMRTPLSAKSLCRARSLAAKKRGLPENLVKFLKERKRKAAESTSLSPSSRA
ncbi:MAG: MucR family transcriptional regulator [Syntrophobacteraceae bacterium]